MTRKNLLIILLILLKIITNSSDSLDFKNSNLSCGKKPTDSTKCSKYGTDSGFLCCYIRVQNEEPYCRLITHKKAESLGIKGELTINGTYFECGNSSNYINFSLFIFLFIFLM